MSLRKAAPWLLKCILSMPLLDRAHAREVSVQLHTLHQDKDLAFATEVRAAHKSFLQDQNRMHRERVKESSGSSDGHEDPRWDVSPSEQLL